MIELLKKDIGLCQNVLIGGAIALFLPYIVTIIYTLNAGGLTRDQTIEMLSLGLLGASGTSVMLAVLSVAFLAGFIVAGERRDRSAEFLAYLPPRKSAVLASKAIVCILWMLIVALVYYLVADCLVPWISAGEVEYAERGREQAWMMIAVSLSVFGVAWLCSCFLESPVLCVLAGMVAPIAVMIAVYLLQLQFGWELESNTAGAIFIGLFFALGVLGFAGGWMHYVSRVEP